MKFKCTLTHPELHPLLWWLVYELTHTHSLWHWCLWVSRCGIVGKLSVCCGTAGEGSRRRVAGRRCPLIGCAPVRRGAQGWRSRGRRRGACPVLLIGGAGGRGWHGDGRRVLQTAGADAERRSLLGDPQQLDLTARQDEVAVEGAHVLASAHPSSGLQHIRLWGLRWGLQGEEGCVDATDLKLVGDGGSRSSSLVLWATLELYSLSVVRNTSDELSSSDRLWKSGESQKERLLKGAVYFVIYSPLGYLWPWTSKPVIRVNFFKLRFIHHLKAE